MLGAMWANSSSNTQWMVKPIEAVLVVAVERIFEPLSSSIDVFPQAFVPGFNQNGRPLKIFNILSTISIAVFSLFAAIRIFLSAWNTSIQDKNAAIVVVFPVCLAAIITTSWFTGISKSVDAS